MKFNYLARTKKGERQTGTIEAPDESIALKTLQDYDLVVIKLQSVETISLFVKQIKIFERIKRKDIFIFFRQLSILVGTDIPLVQSLRALVRQIDSPTLRDRVSSVADDIDGGTAFSKALSVYPAIFSDFCVSLIRTGEVSGRLQESLTYLADYLEKEYYLISRVRGAMIYPAFILSVFLIIGILVMVMVIPQLTTILIEAGQELPLSTKIVIALSNFVIKSGWLVLLFAIGTGFAFWRYKKTKKGEMFWDTIKLKIPIFGKIFQKTYLARLADNLGALVNGGVPIIQSLNIVANAIGNALFKQILLKAKKEVAAGRSISSVLENRKEFPPLFFQMIRTGEKTGKMDVMLEKLSEFYNKEVEHTVDNLSQLIEPILLVLLGIGVSILVFAVFMPIYSLSATF